MNSQTDNPSGGTCKEKENSGPTMLGIRSKRSPYSKQKRGSEAVSDFQKAR
jgi:hypothetical protein